MNIPIILFLLVGNPEEWKPTNNEDFDAIRDSK